MPQTTARTAPSTTDKGTAGPAPRRQPRWRGRLARWDLKASPYLYIAPFFLVFGVVGLFPLLYTGYVSLFDWELGDDNPAFIGLNNYVELFGDTQFFKTLGNTISIFLLSSVPQVAIAVLLAALLNAHLRLPTAWRVGILLPYAASLVAIGIIFANLFGPNYGLVNSVFELLGLDRIDWQANRFASHIAIAIMVNWRWTGYNALIVLAAMKAIPKEIHEAATVDGASAVRRFFSITLPLLRPTLIFVVVTSTIGGMQIFTEPKLFDAMPGSNNGGSTNQFQTVTLYMYQTAFESQHFGYASATAWVLFIIILLIASVNFFITEEAGAMRRAGFWIYGLLVAFVLGSAFPFYWSYLVASRDSGMLTDKIPPLIPGGNFWANAARVFDAVEFWKALANSLIVAGTVAFTTVFFSTLAGFAFAKLRFRGSNGLFLFIVATLAVPTQLGIIPLYMAMADFGWIGGLWAVIVPNLVTALGVFWMRQYTLDAVPYELVEAARMDGCSMIRVYWHVCLPAVRPAAAFLALFTFMTAWNDFLWPLVVLDAGNPTVQVALEKLQSGYYVDYSLVLAGTTLATIPILIVFVVLGRQIVAGIMQGAVKG